MKILLLNGSPRPHGNTAFLSKELVRYCEEKGYETNLLNIGQMKIQGCIACEYCNTKGNGNCVFRDDMDKVNEYLNGNDLVIFMSPVYYWGFSAQMQCMISRLYNRVKIECPKFALILSSASDDVYDAVIAQYKNIVEYFGSEDIGVLTFNGTNQISDENFEKIRSLIDSL